jgi:ABC-2 type transport system permease protein
MTLTLMLPTAYIASIGRGYLPPMGWAVLTIFLSQIIAALGYGDDFPWSVPAIFSGMAGPNAPQTGLHSYIMLLLTGILGLIFTLLWWRSADQTK